jgi:hypothetical protein
MMELPDGVSYAGPVSDTGIPEVHAQILRLGRDMLGSEITRAVSMFVEHNKLGDRYRGTQIFMYHRIDKDEVGISEVWVLVAHKAGG